MEFSQCSFEYTMKIPYCIVSTFNHIHTTYNSMITRSAIFVQ